jgi:hypothetical protein
MVPCKQEGVIAGLEKSIKNLEGWQKSQNGSIIRVEGKIDKLIFWFMTSAITLGVGFAVNIALLLIRR